MVLGWRSRALGLVSGLFGAPGAALLALGLFGFGCNTPNAPEPVSKVTAAATQSASQARAATTAAAPSVSVARLEAKRWVAIGDLHGDLGATRDVLKLAAVIDDKDRWIAGDQVVIQTGDQLDRGDDEQAILDLLHSLSAQAKAAGGSLIVLNGNHETMNALGDFRYVTPAGVHDFEGSGPAAASAAAALRVPAEYAARALAFIPGGKYARLLAERPLIAVVGDAVFVHGGVRLSHVRYGIDRLNRETSQWLLGNTKTPPAPVLDDEGPLWSRVYSTPKPDSAACAELGEVLAALGAKRMVVGHTVQSQGINSACEGRVWRIDVGMAAHYGGSQVAALQFEGGTLRVLQRAKSVLPALPAAAE